LDNESAKKIVPSLQQIHRSPPASEPKRAVDRRLCDEASEKHAEITA
jgi:hypothetical protein